MQYLSTKPRRSDKLRSMRSQLSSRSGPCREATHWTELETRRKEPRIIALLLTCLKLAFCYSRVGERRTTLPKKSEIRWAALWCSSEPETTVASQQLVVWLPVFHLSFLATLQMNFILASTDKGWRSPNPTNGITLPLTFCQGVTVLQEVCRTIAGRVPGLLRSW